MKWIKREKRKFAINSSKNQSSEQGNSLIGITPEVSRLQSTGASGAPASPVWWKHKSCFMKPGDRTGAQQDCALFIRLTTLEPPGTTDIATNIWISPEIARLQSRGIQRKPPQPQIWWKHKSCFHETRGSQGLNWTMHCSADRQNINNPGTHGYCNY